ncbi:MAG: hypothetical protein J3R72DRAFT_453839 [Linnemannia gamsii]|nr:MAG: hypothetical protein J3R72DRAFT_453839 [Linnemannia gamsii]
MCPRLQELYLKRWWFDLSFEAGLSLLARLQDLERVTFASTNRPRLSEESFSWMHPIPPRFTWNRLTHPLSHHWIRARIRKEHEGVPPSSTTAGSQLVERGRELGIDLSKVGYADDLLEWMDERYGAPTTTMPMASRRNNLRHSLPNLQSFRVEFFEGQDVQLQGYEELVARIRPEVDFQLRLGPRNIFYDTTLRHY